MESPDKIKEAAPSAEDDNARESTVNCTPNTQTNPTEPVTLLNFDPYTKKKKFLTSPRSKEALKILGIEEHELLIKTKQDFANEPIPLPFINEKDEYLTLKAAFYDKARQNRLRLCLEERNKLIQRSSQNFTQEQSGFPSINPLKTPMMSIETEKHSVSLMMAGESSKKRLEHLRRRQEKEIEFMIAKEHQLQEMEKKKEEKIQKAQLMEHLKQQEFERRKKESEEAARRRKMLREIEEARMREIERELSEKRLQQEAKWKERQEMMEKKRKEEMELKEHEKKQKFAQLLKRAQEIEQRRIRTSEVKRMILDQRFEQNQRMLAEQREEKARQAKISQEEFERRMQLIVESQRKHQEENLQKYQEKFQRNEEIRQIYEERKQIEIEYKRLRSQTRTREAKEMREKRFQEELEKKMAFVDKLEKVEQNRQNLLSQQQERLQAKLARVEQKEAEVKRRLQIQRELSENQNKALMHELQVHLQRAEYQKIQLLHQKKYQHMVEFLKEEEAKQNLARQEKAREYHKEKLNEKMNLHTLKYQAMEHERQQIRREREAIEKQFQKQKYDLKKAFEQEQKRLITSFSHQARHNSSMNICSKLLTPMPPSSKKIGLPGTDTPIKEQLRAIVRPTLSKRSSLVNTSIDNESNIQRGNSADTRKSQTPLGHAGVRSNVRQGKYKLPHNERISITEGSIDRSESPPSKKNDIDFRNSPLMHNDSSVLQISYNEEDDLLPFDKNLIKFALKQMNKDFLAHLEKEMIRSKNEKEITGACDRLAKIAKVQAEELSKIRKNNNHLKLNNFRKK